MAPSVSAYLYALAAVALWSTVSTAFKLSLQYQSPTGLLLGASFFSLLIIFAVIILQKKTSRLTEGTLGDLVRSALLGFLNPFLYYSVLLRAYRLLPAQEAQALNYLWAVMLALLAIPVLKQKPTLRDMGGLAVSFAGAVTIALRGDFRQMRFQEPLGVSLALASTLIWAIFWLCNVKDRRDETVKLFWIFVFGFMYTAIFALVRGTFRLPTGWALAGSIYVGWFEMGLTFILWLTALQKAEIAARVTNLIFLTPFVSLLFINRILREKIALSTLTGLVLIVGGILWQQSRRKVPPAAAP